MSALERQPKNMNFLASTGYRFSIERLPNVNFFVQGINIPGKKISIAEQTTPYINIPLGGNHLKYNDLTVTFKVDEDLQNYLEIFNWIDAVVPPFDRQNRKHYLQEQTEHTIYSDCMITIMDNNKNANIRVRLVNAFPISISDIIFSSTNTDEEHLVATAIFKYQNLFIESLARNDIGRIAG